MFLAGKLFYNKTVSGAEEGAKDQRAGQLGLLTILFIF